MITVSVLDVQPHPCQTTHNPGDWAVQFRVSRDGVSRTFWRWHTMRKLNANAAYVRPDPVPPQHDEILQRFWDDTFAELGGFSFHKDEPFEDGAWP